MGVELRPFGVACNIGCRYCYQNPQREAGNLTQSYSLERMKAAVEQEGGPFALFGGEPLLLPMADLEELLRWGHERYGQSSVQTNGILISDQHIRLFQAYNVQVGISIDGPGELNDLRWHGSLERTRESTATTLANITRLCREYRPPGIIVTLHRSNAVGERLERLHQFIRDLDELGVQSVRLHLLEVESDAIRQAHALSDDENVRALVSFDELQPSLKQLRFDVLHEMEQNLLGLDRKTSCVWHSCDPYTTPAVRGVEGNGQSSNCGRTNKDGIDFLKAGAPGFERYLALYHTPQEDGGCQGCRFFLMCRGQCPGTALDGDWRNRSELCGVWKRLFARIERRLVLENRVPLSLHPVRPRLERNLVRRWECGRNSSTQDLPWTEAESGAAPPEPVRTAFAGARQQEAWLPRLQAVRVALARIDQLAAARGLSAPACCRDAHTRFAAGPHRDPVWTLLSAAPPEAPAETDLEGPDLLNPWLRPLGIDPLGYVPCSPACAESQALGRARAALGREAGFQAEMDWLEAMLNWPLEWSALHGIAEVKVGVAKFTYRTDYTSARVTVRYHGSALAPDAAKGLSFAYSPPRGATWEPISLLGEVAR